MRRLVSCGDFRDTQAAFFVSCAFFEKGYLILHLVHTLFQSVDLIPLARDHVAEVLNDLILMGEKFFDFIEF